MAEVLSNRGMINDNLLSLSYGKIVNKDINTTDGLLPMSFGFYFGLDTREDYAEEILSDSV